MKQSIRILAAVLAVTSMLISACGSVNAPANPAAAKVRAVEIAFNGVIESIDGNQWTIGGQTVSVDPSVVKDGTFAVGDTVKVEGIVAEDGSISVTSVETPSSDDLAESEAEAEDEVEAPEVEETPDAEDSEEIASDDENEETFGTVDAISADSITIDGQTYPIANGAEFKDEILAGSFVKVHFMVNEDGSLSITEIELADPSDVADDDSEGEDEDEAEDEDEGEDEDEDEDETDDEDDGEDDNSGSESGSDDDEDDNSGSGNDNSDDDDSDD